MATLPEDILQVIPDHEIEKVYETFMQEWPKSAYHYGFLKTCYDWCKKNPTFDASFFHCESNKESGIFIGILNSGHRTFGVIPYAKEGYELQLKKVLMETKRIDWNKLPLLQGVLPRHYELMEDVVKEKGFTTSMYCDSTIQLLDPKLAADYDISCPDNVYVKKLTTEDNVDLIYERWTNKVIHTKEDIINIIELSFAYGIFSKSDNELLAWVMLSHYGAIGTLYTMEHARKCGYAKILIKIISKELVQEMIPIYTAIVVKNITSISLFQSIGFKQVGNFRYVNVVRN
ncbi:uncharacterized protein LOC135836269 [Planococcus citri]|uniref:uncharacterized protein LOC135836269 n=1 Tax=Planococcus citri TaxID=170843 RepID=UPI0031F81A0D